MSCKLLVLANIVSLMVDWLFCFHPPGANLQREDRDLPSTYIQNPHSMYKMTYSCVFLVARKPATGGTGTSSRDNSQPSTPQTLARGDGGMDAQSTAVLQTAEPVQTVTDSTMALQTQSVTGVTTQS